MVGLHGSHPHRVGLAHSPYVDCLRVVERDLHDVRQADGGTLVHHDVAGDGVTVQFAPDHSVLLLISQ